MSVSLPNLFLQREAFLREKCANKIRELHPNWDLDRIAQTVEKVMQSMRNSCFPEATINYDPEVTKIGLEILSDRDLSEEKFNDIQKRDLANIKRLVNDVSDGTKIPLEQCIHILKDPVQPTAQKCHAVVCNVAEKLLQCAGCEKVFYCSKEHQRADWKRHQPNCDPSPERKWRQITREFGQMGADLFS